MAKEEYLRPEVDDPGPTDKQSRPEEEDLRPATEDPGLAANECPRPEEEDPGPTEEICPQTEGKDPDLADKDLRPKVYCPRSEAKDPRPVHEQPRVEEEDPGPMEEHLGINKVLERTLFDPCRVVKAYQRTDGVLGGPAANNFQLGTLTEDRMATG
jgi:hypothetical protein